MIGRASVYRVLEAGWRNAQLSTNIQRVSPDVGQSHGKVNLIALVSRNHPPGTSLLPRARGIVMRGVAAPIIAASFLNLCSCSSHMGESAIKAEQSITASCQAWEDRARKAARPDADLIAQHDRLLAKAAKFSADAQAHYKDVAVRDAAIGNAAQPKSKRTPSMTGNTI